jgi:hypothetical protein
MTKCPVVSGWWFVVGCWGGRHTPGAPLSAPIKHLDTPRLYPNVPRRARSFWGVLLAHSAWGSQINKGAGKRTIRSYGGHGGANCCRGGTTRRRYHQGTETRRRTKMLATGSEDTEDAQRGRGIGSLVRWVILYLIIYAFRHLANWGEDDFSFFIFPLSLKAGRGGRQIRRMARMGWGWRSGFEEAGVEAGGGAARTRNPWCLLFAYGLMQSSVMSGVGSP